MGAIELAINFLPSTGFFVLFNAIQLYGPNILWKCYNLCTRPVSLCVFSIRIFFFIMISKCCSSELDTYVCSLACWRVPKHRVTLSWQMIVCWQLFEHVYEFCNAVAVKNEYNFICICENCTILYCCFATYNIQFISSMKKKW